MEVTLKTTFMKQLRNKILALSLILFAAFTFSSCDKDEFEWREAELGFKTIVQVPSTGIITHTFTVGQDWIEVMNGGKYIHIEDFTYRKGDIEVYAGPNIDFLSFRLEGVPDVGFDYIIRGNQGDMIKDTKPAIRDFYEAVTEMIRMHGAATIHVGGKSQPYKDITLDILFDLSAYVSF